MKKIRPFFVSGQKYVIRRAVFDLAVKVPGRGKGGFHFHAAFAFEIRRDFLESGDEVGRHRDRKFILGKNMKRCSKNTQHQHDNKNGFFHGNDFSLSFKYV